MAKQIDVSKEESAELCRLLGFKESIVLPSIRMATVAGRMYYNYTDLIDALRFAADKTIDDQKQMAILGIVKWFQILEREV